MTITPQEAREQYMEANADLLKNLEAKIDRALAENPDKEYGVCISVPDELIHGYPIYEKLEERYREAGWNMKYESDQRDGDFLRFTPRRKAKTTVTVPREGTGMDGIVYGER